MKTILILILFLVSIPHAVLSLRGEDTEGIRIQKDIVYRTVDGKQLAFDMARPLEGTGPFPWVVCIHGGGWQKGNKSVPPYQQLLKMLATNGYVAVSVAYRFAPESKFPAQIEDVKCAIRYLRAHAGEYQIQPDKVAAIGHSAGGHLALLVGMTGSSGEFDSKDCDHGIPSKVQAVVNYFGPTHFSRWIIPAKTEQTIRKTYGKSSDEVLADFLGTGDRSAPVMKVVSPITYIDNGDPPVLTFHGTLDPQVSFEQATLLHEALRKSGVEEELVVMEGAGHGWQGSRLEFTNRKLLEFLKRQIGEKNPEAVSN